MNARQRAIEFVRRYPTNTWTHREFMITAIEIELMEFARQETQKYQKPVQQEKRKYGRGISLDAPFIQ